MPGSVSVALLVLFGLALGTLFYGGLWFTVRALAGSPHPVALALASFWGRMLLALAGFALVTAHRWQNALLCLAGFVLARVLLARWIPGRKAAQRTVM